MSQQVENLNKVTEKQKHTEETKLLELKITRSEIKNGLAGLNSGFG